MSNSHCGLISYASPLALPSFWYCHCLELLEEFGLYGFVVRNAKWSKLGNDVMVRICHPEMDGVR